MPNSAHQEPTQVHLETLNEALSSGTFVQVRRMINALPTADVALLMESAPPKARQVIWQLVDMEDKGEILQELSLDIQSQFLEQMDADEVVAITEGLEPDDIADIVQQLPDQVTQAVLNSMDMQDRLRLEKVLPYAEDTAGGLMNTDTITVRPKITLDVVLRYLRRHEELPAMTDNLIVVTRDDEFLGLLPISQVLVGDPSTTVREVMHTGIKPIPATMPAGEVANLFERHDWVSAPVVGERGELLGRITIDDVVDVIREEADHSLMSMAGLDEDEDTFAPVVKAMPRRAIWLGINLLSAFIASAVINIFEQTIDKVVALAILMPIVASMGGVAGSQTLTVVIRGMALGHIGKSNTNWLMNRELLLAFSNGLLWALVAAVAASIWFHDQLIGFLIAAAMVINLSVAALSGVLVPLTLRKLKIDPALAGTVVLTTITDAAGFLSFLGLAAYFYA
jgi:magnesium transporter